MHISRSAIIYLTIGIIIFILNKISILYEVEQKDLSLKRTVHFLVVMTLIFYYVFLMIGVLILIWTYL